MAQDEVRKISERTKFGFKRTLEKGTVLDTDNIWGYKKNKGKLEIDEEEAPLIRDTLAIIQVDYQQLWIIEVKREILMTNQNGKCIRIMKKFHQLCQRNYGKRQIKNY